MKQIIALVALLVISGPALAIESVATLAGIVVAKDGDGILFGKVEIRLQGIVAPEFNRRKKEPGGKESLDNLRALVDGKSVRCEPDGTLARQRPVGVCFVGNLEIGRQQILTGHARDCEHFSGGRYADSELVALNKTLDSRTFAIVTLAAANNISHIHDRMPVILKQDAIASWMDGDTSKDDALDLLQENRGAGLVYHPVSKEVGAVKNKEPELIDPAP